MQATDNIYFNIYFFGESLILNTFYTFVYVLFSLLFLFLKYCLSSFFPTYVLEFHILINTFYIVLL